MKYNWFEGTVPRSGFMVYHLKAEIGTKELGKFTESDFIFSEVYSNRKKAESAGRKFLKIKLKDMQDIIKMISIHLRIFTNTVHEM